MAPTPECRRVLPSAVAAAGSPFWRAIELSTRDPTRWAVRTRDVERKSKREPLGLKPLVAKNAREETELLILIFGNIAFDPG